MLSEHFQQKMADDNEIIKQDRFSGEPALTIVDPNYLDLQEQCESLRRSNLQLREEILLLDRENNDLKKKTKGQLYFKNFTKPT